MMEEAQQEEWGEGGEETIKYMFMLALRERKLYIEVLRRQLREQKTQPLTLQGNEENGVTVHDTIFENRSTTFCQVLNCEKKDSAFLYRFRYFFWTQFLFGYSIILFFIYLPIISLCNIVPKQRLIKNYQALFCLYLAKHA